MAVLPGTDVTTLDKYDVIAAMSGVVRDAVKRILLVRSHAARPGCVAKESQETAVADATGLPMMLVHQVFSSADVYDGIWEAPKE